MEREKGVCVRTLELSVVVVIVVLILYRSEAGGGDDSPASRMARVNVHRTQEPKL